MNVAGEEGIKETEPTDVLLCRLGRRAHPRDRGVAGWSNTTSRDAAIIFASSMPGCARNCRFPEISDLLGINVTSAENCYRHARQRLMEKLQEVVRRHVHRYAAPGERDG